MAPCSLLKKKSCARARAHNGDLQIRTWGYVGYTATCAEQFFAKVIFSKFPFLVFKTFLLWAFSIFFVMCWVFRARFSLRVLPFLCSPPPDIPFLGGGLLVFGMRAVIINVLVRLGGAHACIYIYIYIYIYI